MKKYIKSVIVLGVFLTAYSLHYSTAFAETHITPDLGFLEENEVWDASSSPYIIETDMTVPFGKSLTIRPGVVVTTDSSVYAEPVINVSGSLHIEGEATNTVSVSGIYGFAVDGTTTMKYARLAAREGVAFYGGYGVISSSTITGADKGVYSQLSEVHINGSKITGNDYGVFVEQPPLIFQVRRNGTEGHIEGTGGIGNALEPLLAQVSAGPGSTSTSMVTIRDSALVDNNIATIKNTENGIVHAEGNWWGSKDGPASTTIIGQVAYQPWLDHDPTIEATSTACCSSVLFLPGLEGTWLSRVEPLLIGHGTTTNTLWFPNMNDDVRKLFLKANGSSTDSSIYSGDPIGKVFNYYSVYDSFMKFMDGLVHDGTIGEWKSFGYDWRKPIAEVVAGPEKKATTTESLIDTVRNLASRSRTGKVTLIGHSNGGLVAKYLTKVLTDQNLSNLIDNVIAVATPYVGTPTALGSLLHGDYQEIAAGLLVKASVARALGVNMASAYSLLPSAGYFSAVTAPTIVFASTSVDGANDGSYDQVVHTYPAQSAFITDSARVRSAPPEEDTTHPAIGNSTLMSASDALHSVLDTFSWPSGIDPWAILGWNVETPRDLTYSSVEHCSTMLWFKWNCSTELVHTAKVTHMGDGTVVAPSAGYHSVSGQEFSIDLDQASKNAGTNITHAYILESTSTQGVIEDIITHKIKNGGTVLGAGGSGVTSGEPDYTKEPVRLVVSLDADAELHVTDPQGRHTGVVAPPAEVTDDTLIAYEEKIPSSHFSLTSGVSGTASRISLPSSGERYTAVVQGGSVGSFTLNVDKVHGDNNLGHIEYDDIPMTSLSIATTTVVAIIDNATLSTTSVSTLQVDIDGDGTTDLVATSTATSTGNSWQSPAVELELYKKFIKTISGSLGRGRTLADRISKLQDLFKRGMLRPHENKKWKDVLKGKGRGFRHISLKKMSSQDRDYMLDSIDALISRFE